MERRITQWQPRKELVPAAHRRYVCRDAVLRAFARSAASDAAAFRADVDGLLDQDATPRA
jgi:hypothetical protein